MLRRGDTSVWETEIFQLELSRLQLNLLFLLANILLFALRLFRDVRRLVLPNEIGFLQTDLEFSTGILQFGSCRTF